MEGLLGVYAESAGDQKLAAGFAERLGVSVLHAPVAARKEASGGILIIVRDGIATLQPTGPDASGAITVGFEDEALAHRRRSGHNELLGRAVGWRKARAPSVLDATGGFGRDAFLLADLGCDVLLCERQPLMALLLGEALRRARSADNQWLNDVASRMRLHSGDARQVSAGRGDGLDVIYLDPMFPSGRKAAPGKEMQMLQRLVFGNESEFASKRRSDNAVGRAANDSNSTDSKLDAAELLRWALEQDVKRVVVKRPLRAPHLSDARPGHSLKGRAVRFDVYPCKKGDDESSRTAPGTTGPESLSIQRNSREY